MAPATPPPPYGRSQYGPVKRGRGPLVVVGVLVLVLVAVLVVGTVVVVRRLSDSEPTATATQPSDPRAVEFRRVLKAAPGGCASTSPTPAAPSFCGLDGYNYVLGEVELDGSHVSEVKAAQSPDNNGWHIDLSLDAEGTTRFGRLTTDLAARQSPLNQIAIVVRGRVAAAPAVMSPIPGGKVQISGNYSKDDAENLARQITG
ncbi:SecDF P1 head subdomain-containing protein [Kribbella swartbergensis]